VIAEDSVLLRVGLVKVLEAVGYEVVAAVGDAEQLLAAVAEHRPDVVVTDVRMPPGYTDEGVRAALLIRRQWPEVAVLLLSQYVEERYAADLLVGNTRGVGYLLKERVANVDDFLDALERVAGGGTSCCCAGRAGPWTRSPRANARSSAGWRRACPTRPSRGRWWSARAPWPNTSTASSPSSSSPRPRASTAG
jgi:DNA-binding NarL/FixJ family response regulator